MNSLVGLGVFGTFGQPFGFQQTFYLGVDFNESLDLDENAIEVYPGNELYAVKRELVNGVYSVSFCIYSYVKELYSDRIGTFIGTCIVLQDGYAEADYIYRLLREVHNDTVNNTQNVESNTIKVQQAQNLIVREPADFIAVKANAIPVSKTPFYSTFVDPHKKILVRPDNSNSSAESKVTAFFDESLKYFTDADTMYFTFDEDVTAYAQKQGYIKIISWDEMIAQKTRQQQYAVVRTKKGIHRHSDMNETANAMAAADSVVEPTVREESPVYKDIPITAEPATDFSDPRRPFDLWDNPEDLWTMAEINYRVKEYNRLFNYTSSLLEHIQTSGKKGSKPDVPMIGSAPKQKPKSNKKSLRRILLGSKRRRGIMLLLVAGLLCLCGGVYNFFFNKNNQSIVSNTAVVPVKKLEPVAPQPNLDSIKAAAAADSLRAAQSADTVVPHRIEGDKAAIAQATEQSLKSTLRKSTSKVPKPESVAPPEKVLPEPYVPDDYMALSKKAGDSIRTIKSIAKTAQHAQQTPIAPQPATTIPVAKKKVAPIASATTKTEAAPSKPKNDYLGVKDLRPMPNFEISQNDIVALTRSGIKNKTVEEIVKIVFDNVPTNIGNVYRGQETDYIGLLLSANKQSFQKVGDDYVCTSDVVVLHIPAYRAPRLPVVFPK